MKNILAHLRFSWKFLIGFKYLFFIDIFIKIISLLVSLFLPILYAELIASISSLSSTRAIYVLSFIISLQAISIILSYILGRIENRIIKNVSCNTQKTLEKQILAIPPQFTKEYEDGNLFSMIVRDSGIPISYLFTMVNVLFNVVTLISIGGIVFFISWELSLVILGAYPIIYIINRIYGKKLRMKQAEWIKSSDSFVGYLKKITFSLNFIKSNKGEVKVCEAFNKKIDEVKDKGLELETLKLNNNTFINLIDIVGYAAINFIGIILIIADKLLFSGFVAFNNYSTKFSSSLNSIVSLNANLQPAFVIFQRLERLDGLYQKSIIIDSEKKVIDDSGIDLKVKNLSISLSNRKIFEDINFDIKAGQIIKLKGKNGCGKTTILKILMQEYVNYDGKVSIGDTELQSFSYSSIQDNFTYLQQNAPLLPLTLFDNLTLFDSARLIEEEEVVNVCKAVGLWNNISLLPDGLYTVVSDNFSLSAGQIQKLQFARALLRNTPIFLIDEVTANLDNDSTLIILNLCNELKKRGKCIIYISHFDEEIINADKCFEFVS